MTVLGLNLGARYHLHRCSTFGALGVLPSIPHLGSVHIWLYPPAPSGTLHNMLVVCWELSTGSDHHLLREWAQLGPAPGVMVVSAVFEPNVQHNIPLTVNPQVRRSGNVFSLSFFAFLNLFFFICWLILRRPSIYNKRIGSSISYSPGIIAQF